jgi:two-component system response regulator VicR
MQNRILVVEDEIVLRDTLVYNLEHQGFIVEAVGDGNAAVQAARQNKPDLIILDIMLPFIDGFEVCRIIRQGMNMPIVFMTALDEEIDRVIGLEIGGDDYVIKPFSMRELVARVKARLRMTRMIREQTSSINPVEESASGIKAYGNLTVNEKRREIMVNGKVLIL